MERVETPTIALNKLQGDDPFAKEMNTWRIKPLKSESTAAIKLRTLNYLQFLKTYYQFVEKNELTTLTFSWYATPIQMHYSNGARMAYNNELVDWYSCFYSIEEANEAYKLIARGMQKSKINKFESRSERNEDYIMQLINSLK